MAGFTVLPYAFYVLGMFYVLTPHPWEDPSLAGWPLILFIGALLQFLFLFAFSFIGIVPLVGGVCALLRRRWGLAFAGAIATVPLYFIAPLGVGQWAGHKYGIAGHYFIWLPLLLSIAVITLIIRSKREFAS